MQFVSLPTTIKFLTNNNFIDFPLIASAKANLDTSPIGLLHRFTGLLYFYCKFSYKTKILIVYLRCYYVFKL